MSRSASWNVGYLPYTRDDTSLAIRIVSLRGALELARDVPLSNDMLELVARLVGHEHLDAVELLLVRGLGDALGPRLVHAQRLDDRIVRQERNVLGEVVGLVMAAAFVRRLTWIDALQDAEFAAGNART